MGRWVILLGVVSAVGCADGGRVDPTAQNPALPADECLANETLPCTADPNGPKIVCMGGRWDDSNCASPMGGSGS